MPPGRPRDISNPTCPKQRHPYLPLRKKYPPSPCRISTLAKCPQARPSSSQASAQLYKMEPVWDFPTIHSSTEKQGQLFKGQSPTVRSGMFRISWPGLGPRYLQSVKAPHVIVTINRIRATTTCHHCPSFLVPGAPVLPRLPYLPSCFLILIYLNSLVGLRL